MDARVEPEVLLEHRSFLRNLAWSLLHDQHAAEDVAQDAMLAAMRRPPRTGNLRAWLGRVTRNLALTQRRNEQRRAARERSAARRESLPSAEEAVARVELQRRVIEAVLALEEPYRSTIVQRFFYDLSSGEIAKRLDIPVETIRTRTKRALARLRARLDASHGGDRSAWCLGLLALFPARRAAAGTAAGGAIVMGMKAKLALLAVLLVAVWGTLWYQGADEAPARQAATRGPSPDRKHSPGSPVAVPIDRDLDLHGDVVDPAGNPIRGAKVTFLFFPGRRMMDWLRPETVGPSTQTDAKGEFRLRLDRGDVGDLRIFAEGFAPQQRGYLQAGERLHIVLSPGVRLTVKVENPAGIPVAGATVRVYRGSKRGGVAFDLSGRSGAEGRCVFSDLCATPLASVRADHPEYGGGDERVSIASTADQAITVRLKEGKTISGTVRDLLAGTPVAEAKLAVGFRSATSGPDGRYEFAGIGPGSLIEASAEGYAPGWYRPGATQPFDINMSRGYLVTGRVVDADNGPVVDAGIVVFSFSQSGFQYRMAVMNRTETSSDGSFGVRVEGRERVHLLVVVAKNHGRLHLDFEAQGDRDLGDLRLPTSRTIAGRVLDQAGRPLPRVKIEARGTNSDRARLRDGKRLPGVAFYGANDTRYTDDLGRFRFPDLAPGVYDLWVQPAGRRILCETHELPSDRDLLGLDVRLKGAWTFTVTVVDRDERPVAGVHLSIGTRTGRVFAKTAENGIAQVSVEGPPAVTEVAVASGDRYLPPHPRKVYPGESEVRLVLDRAGAVSGQVVGPDGKPLRRRAGIDVRRGDEVVVTATVRADGTFRARVPVTGLVDLVLNGRVWNGGGDATEIETEQFFFTGVVRGVSAGLTGLVLRARPVTFDRSLMVRVVSPDGDPVEGVVVQAFPTRTAKGHTLLTTNASGIVKFAGLPSRAVNIRYAEGPRHQESGFAPPRVALRRVIPNGQELEFRLRATIVMRGRATLPDGAPAPGAQITAWLDGSQLVAMVFAGRDGRFEFRVPPEWDKLVVGATYAQRAGADLRRYSGHVRVDSCADDVKLSLAPAR